MRTVYKLPCAKWLECFAVLVVFFEKVPLLNRNFWCHIVLFFVAYNLITRNIAGIDIAKLVHKWCSFFELCQTRIKSQAKTRRLNEKKTIENVCCPRNISTPGTTVVVVRFDILSFFVVCCCWFAFGLLVCYIRTFIAHCWHTEARITKYIRTQRYI